MILCGVQSFPLRADGKRFMKLCFTKDFDNIGEHVGTDVFSEITPYNGDYLANLGENVEVIYRKSFDGKAVFDHLVRKEKK